MRKLTNLTRYISVHVYTHRTQIITRHNDILCCRYILNNNNNILIQRSPTTNKQKKHDFLKEQLNRLSEW